MTHNGQNGLKIVLIVLAYNNVEDTLECLQSLSEVSSPEFETILVDNGSTDGTNAIVSERFPAVHVLRLSPNVGIARGYNHGLEYAMRRDSDYTIVLNNDTVVDPAFIQQMLKTFEERPGISMVMPKIYHFFGKPGKLWSTGARWRAFPPSIKMLGAGEMDGPLYMRNIEIEFAPSCCLMLKSNALREVGFFDPKYFFYFDDWDLCERFRKAGKIIYFSANAKIWHKVALSTLKSDPPATWWKVMGESSVRFFLKHKSVLTLALHTGWIILREVVKLKFTHAIAFASGVLSGWKRIWSTQNPDAS